MWSAQLYRGTATRKQRKQSSDGIPRCPAKRRCFPKTNTPSLIGRRRNIGRAYIVSVGDGEHFGSALTAVYRASQVDESEPAHQPTRILRLWRIILHSLTSPQEGDEPLPLNTEGKLHRATARLPVFDPRTSPMCARDPMLVHAMRIANCLQPAFC